MAVQPIRPDTPTGEMLDPSLEPIQPIQPTEAWDIVGWANYVLEMIYYVFSMIVYVLKVLVVGLGNIVQGTLSFITEMNRTISFLPAELLTVIEIGVIVVIVLKFIKR